MARELLEADPRFARAEALRAVGLAGFADEEMDELTRRSLGEPKRLYALSSVYAQESRYHLALRILRRHFQAYARSGLATLPRAFWEMYYPLGWRAELTEAAGRAIIDPLLVAAVVREESSFYPQARSRVGARGLMQLMPDTARPMAQARRLPFNNGDLLDDPAANLDMGSGYLSGLLREFGDARLAAAAYNAGPTRVREWWGGRRSDDLEVWVEQIPFNETRAFVKRVMLSWDEYRRLYGAASSAEPPPALVPTAAETVTDLTTAGFWRRGAAAALDGAIGALVWLWSAMCIVVGVWGFRTSPLELGDAALLLAAILALGIVLHVVYHVAFVGGCGPDPGAHGAGDRGGATRRRAPGYGRALARCLGGCISIVTLGLAGLGMLVTRERRGLADWIAGTRVVRAGRLKKAHLLRWRPRQPAQRRATTPRRLPSGAASQLDLFEPPAGFRIRLRASRRIAVANRGVQLDNGVTPRWGALARLSGVAKRASVRRTGDAGQAGRGIQGRGDHTVRHVPEPARVHGGSGRGLALGPGGANAAPPAPASRSRPPPTPPTTSRIPPTPLKDVTTYNNFYEFGVNKEDPAQLAQTLKPRPWTVAGRRPGAQAADVRHRRHPQDGAARGARLLGCAASRGGPW